MARQDELTGHEGQHSAEVLRTVAMAVQEAAKKSEGPYPA